MEVGDSVYCADEGEYDLVSIDPIIGDRYKKVLSVGKINLKKI